MGMYQQAAQQMALPSFATAYKNALDIKNLKQQAQDKTEASKREQMKYEAEAYMKALSTGNDEQAKQVLDMYGVEHEGPFNFAPKSKKVNLNIGGAKFNGDSQLAMDFFDAVESGHVESSDDMVKALKLIAGKMGDGDSLTFNGAEQVPKYQNYTNGKITTTINENDPQEVQKMLSSGWYKGKAGSKRIDDTAKYEKALSKVASISRTIGKLQDGDRGALDMVMEMMRANNPKKFKAEVDKRGPNEQQAAAIEFYQKELEYYKKIVGDYDAQINEKRSAGADFKFNLNGDLL